MFYAYDKKLDQFCTNLTFLSLISIINVDFINVLRVAFAHTDPESAKKTDTLSVFFALLGSTGIKAACRTLMISISHVKIKDEDCREQG